MTERPRPVRLEGMPMAPGGQANPLTKPVRAAERRPTPRWVGWVLIALPTLAVLGFWLGPRVPALTVLVAVLGVVAAWDWWRFQDRSRALRAAYLGLILLATGGLLLLVRRLPLGAASGELVTLGGATILALALIQLYRSAETVLTVTRGWLYLLGLLAVVTVYQRLTHGPLPLSGPFVTPENLAVAALTGLTLMPLGCALEHDRRLVWAYPVAAGLAVEVLWWSRQTFALAMAAAVIILWLALGRRTRWILAGAVAAVGLALALYPDAGALPWPRPAVDLATRRELADLGFRLLRDSWFLGAGPGTFAPAATAAGLPSGPYSPLVEVAAEYGFGVTVLILLAGLGVLRWCLHRLIRTPGRDWTEPHRAAAIWCGAIVLGAPVAGSLQPTWLNVPLSALILGTIGLLARHVEDTQGRRVASRV
ncbi:MAG: hypothetical protein LBR33_02680 [Propionibacteriaceae bacterium]|nr:hypothetical protein [Propionibacteriaceae bacterium]